MVDVITLYAVVIILAIAGAAGITYYFKKTKHGILSVLGVLFILCVAFLFWIIPIVMQACC